MRRKGQGTFDHSNATWKIPGRIDPTTGKPIRKSTRQLGKLFGIEIPKSEKASEPYWRKFLERIDQEREETRKANAPQQLLIWSLERLIHLQEQLGRDASIYKQELEAAKNVPAHSIDHPDCLAIPVEMRELKADLQDVILYSQVEPKFIQAKPNKKGSLEKEIETYNALHKGKPNASDIRKSLALFLEVAGDIPLKDITVNQFRAFNERLLALYPADHNGRTRYNKQGFVIAFLDTVSRDHNLFFGFLKTRKYRFKKPEGQKVQYSIEEMKKAIAHATGKERTILLLGLNCGFYSGDIAELKPEHVKEGHIQKPRAKHKHIETPFLGYWYLWEETRKALDETGFDLGTSQTIEKTFKGFKTEHGLKDHKALRKGMVQMIWDKCGSEEARLYKGEKVGGVAGQFYVEMSEEQKKKIDSALQTMEKLLFAD